jgi:serine/threonine protein kinase
LLPGSIFHGDFRVENHPVKFGGMGEVYKATNIINGAPVAIKLIRSELSNDTEILERFRDEDDALRRLNNPAIVRYFGVRRDPELDRLYIVMEYVDGPSLGEHVSTSGALPPSAVEDLCRRLASGLQEAHAQGVIHRDLSPDNILLADGDPRKPKIIDFGIAKINLGNNFTVYRTNFVGKYLYASPEHYSQTARVDEKSDIYSLGLVLAAAAKGAPLDMGRDELTGATARIRTPDLSAIPAQLRPIMIRMLDPKPANRPTAAELARLYENPPGRRTGPRRPIAIWVAGAILVTAAAGFAAAQLWQSHGAVDGSNSTGSTISTPQPVAPQIVPPSVGTVPASVAIEPINRAINARPETCAPLRASAMPSGHVALEGLVAAAPDYASVKASAANSGATLDDLVIVSAPACETIRWLTRIGKMNMTTGANRPVLSAGRMPPIFHIGETVRVGMVIPAVTGRHLYKIFLDDRGNALVQHSYERAFTQAQSVATVSEPGWNIIFLVSSRNELIVLSSLDKTNNDQLNHALSLQMESMGSSADIISAYQIIYRTSSN